MKLEILYKAEIDYSYSVIADEKGNDFAVVTEEKQAKEIINKVNSEIENLHTQNCELKQIVKELIAVHRAGDKEIPRELLERAWAVIE